MSQSTGSPDHKEDPLARSGPGSAEKRHLDLSEIRVSRRLARGLPAELAYRYQAVPVASEGGYVTVVMAHPEDKAACEAISAVLGEGLIFVRGEAEAIDSLLADIWGQRQGSQLGLVACVGEGQGKEEVQVYAENLAVALSGSLRWMPRPEKVDTLAEVITAETRRGVVDLVVMREAPSSGVGFLVRNEAEALAKQRLPASLLILRQPTWPIRRVLLILSCDAADISAVEWVARIARPSGAEVVVLTLVPPVPSVYNGLERMEPRLSEVLATDTSLGKELRSVAKTLVEWDVDATLRLRQGLPEWEIKHELAEGEYDLVTVAGESDHGILGKGAPGIVASALACACCPVLIARAGAFSEGGKR